MTKKIHLYKHPIVKAAARKACIASSLKRAASDVAAAGGIEFEISFQKHINENRSKSFPFLALLKRDLELNDCYKQVGLDWGNLKSKENFLQNQAKSWNDQSNVDIVFFKKAGNKWVYYDAWSLKTTVSIDVKKTTGQITTKGKATTWLDLVNLKDKQMSVILKSFKDNAEKEIKAGRCFLAICNNGKYSCYFWDGNVSNLCKMMIVEGFKINKDKEKNITFNNKNHTNNLIICSKRASVGAPTSFGRALQISAAPSLTKNRKANFMAEMLAKGKVFQKITTGNFSCKQKLKSSFKSRLNIK